MPCSPRLSGRRAAFRPCSSPPAGLQSPHIQLPLGWCCPCPASPCGSRWLSAFFLFYRHSWLWKCGDAAGGLSPQTLGQVLWVKCLWDRGRGGGCGAYRNCGTLLGCHRHRWCGEEPGEAALNQVSAEGAVRSIQKRVQNQPCFKDRSNAWCSLVKELV